MQVARDEIFGPIVVVITYKDEDEAIAIANDTEFGLAASVYSSDHERATRVARRLQSGSVGVNTAGFSLTEPEVAAVLADQDLLSGNELQDSFGATHPAHSEDFTPPNLTLVSSVGSKW
jgi:hypothetical protein